MMISLFEHKKALRKNDVHYLKLLLIMSLLSGFYVFIDAVLRESVLIFVGALCLFGTSVGLCVLMRADKKELEELERIE